MLNISNPKVQALQIIYSLRNNKSESYNVSARDLVIAEGNKSCLIDLSRYLYTSLDMATTLIICFQDDQLVPSNLSSFAKVDICIAG